MLLRGEDKASIYDLTARKVSGWSATTRYERTLTYRYSSFDTLAVQFSGCSILDVPLYLRV